MLPRVSTLAAALCAALLLLGVVPPALAQDDAPRPADVPEESGLPVDFGFFAHAGVGGLYGDNLGVSLGGHITLDDIHSIELSLSLAGGYVLQTAAQLRYRLQITDAFAWYVAPGGILFEFLLPDADTVVWTRATVFSTGIEIDLIPDTLYLGVDLSLTPRVYPLAITFVDTDGQPRREITHHSQEALFDVTEGLLHPGVVLGYRL